MKIIILTLLLLLCGCGVPPGAYYQILNDNYNDYVWQMQANRAFWAQQMQNTRQNELMFQQNQILQQRGYR